MSKLRFVIGITAASLMLVFTVIGFYYANQSSTPLTTYQWFVYLPQFFGAMAFIAFYIVVYRRSKNKK